MNVIRLVTEYSKREMKVLSSWVVIKMEKLQILEIYDVGRREDTDKSNSQVSGMNKWNDINYAFIWKCQV